MLNPYRILTVHIQITIMRFQFEDHRAEPSDTRRLGFQGAATSRNTPSSRRTRTALRVYRIQGLGFVAVMGLI